MVRLSREERETVINKSEADEGWSVYSSCPAVMRRLDRWAKTVDVQKVDGQIISKEYEVPRQCVNPQTEEDQSGGEGSAEAAWVAVGFGTGGGVTHSCRHSALLSRFP
jgi:hypothetical protein